jgi:8-oxo-dGTP pyrophosphatase MutT (NUDIX family)
MKHPHLLDSDKKASVIILVNEDKKVLLQLRDGNAPTAPNKWAFFGGGGHPDEDPYRCVLRECKQELGIELVDPVLIIARCMDHPHFDEEYIYIERISDIKIKSIQQAEGADRGWFTYPQALQLDMVEDKKAILAAVFEYISRVM